ncbi:hypothetical protein MTBUT4_250004 [Magnetospirillum sp. UT-4]|nr:hypothetical protein MTBUT4_250004 [Magnetospirillum sp. UT-4]
MRGAAERERACVCMCRPVGGPMAGAPALTLPASGQGQFPPYVIAGLDPAIHGSHAHHPAGRVAGGDSCNTDERRWMYRTCPGCEDIRLGAGRLAGKLSALAP